MESKPEYPAENFDKMLTHGLSRSLKRNLRPNKRDISINPTKADKTATSNKFTQSLEQLLKRSAMNVVSNQGQGIVDEHIGRRIIRHYHNSSCRDALHPARLSSISVKAINRRLDAIRVDIKKAYVPIWNASKVLIVNSGLGS